MIEKHLETETKPLPVASVGRVASLHVHPVEPGAPLPAVELINVVADKGVAEDRRYFDRRQQAGGKPNRRQVTLIDREQIAEHAAALGLETIAPGAVRANIETVGINLQDLVGREVEIGDAVLLCYESSKPCSKMDAICQGLRELMQEGRQGVLAEVVKSGIIRPGDIIRARTR